MRGWAAKNDATTSDRQEPVLKRTALLLVVLTIAASTTGSSLAAAKKSPPKPVTKTFYFHGSNPVGEAENPPTSNTTLTMDASKPTGSQPSTYGVTNALATPNDNCSNNTLFPTWTGQTSGYVTGTAKVPIHTASTPASKLLVRLFADPGPLACNDTFVAPLASATVDVPPGAGSVTATLQVLTTNKVNKVRSELVLEVTPAVLAEPVYGPSVTRVLYNAASYASALTFSCLPLEGKKTC